MREEIRHRIDEYPPQDLLLAAVIAGVASFECTRLHLGNTELYVGSKKTGGLKRFDLPVDLAWFPVLSGFPQEVVIALRAALHKELDG